MKMGITIVQKSDLSVRKRDSKIALVLAGGAVTGGAFKLGGVKALDDFLLNRKSTDFDTYIGLSAGAVIAAPLATGISPAEMIKSLEGKSQHFTQLRPFDFYNPNFSEFAKRPIQFITDSLAYLPGMITDILAESPKVAREMQSSAEEAFREPSWDSLQALIEPINNALAKRRSLPSPVNYLPSGVFDNSSLERYLRENLDQIGLPNDFGDLYRSTGKELYISAMNLDTAERVVFGHDEENSIPVSEAVQASSALPGFYKPARINGVDYVDGGVRRTANIDVAIEHGADLIICYNPFRPFSNKVTEGAKDGHPYTKGRPLSESGLLTVINQVLRTLLHSRLQYGIRQYRDDPNFKGDIIVIEPKETDWRFFQLNALAYWQRIRAAKYGYLSAIESISEHYDLMREILESYGISMTRRRVQTNLERFRENDPEVTSEVLTNDVAARDLSAA